MLHVHFFACNAAVFIALSTAYLIFLTELCARAYYIVFVFVIVVYAVRCACLCASLRILRFFFNFDFFARLFTFWAQFEWAPPQSMLPQLYKNKKKFKKL